MTTQLPVWLTTDNPEAFYREGKCLILDLETDNEDFGSALTENNDIVLACWEIRDIRTGRLLKRAHCWGGIYEQQELIDDINSVDFIVAQNAKFELQWMKRCGVELRDVHAYDTMLGAWVLDGNRNRPRDLNALARRYGIKGKLDVVSQLIKLGVNVRDINPAWVLEYCYQDVNIAWQVFVGQSDELSFNDQWHLVHVRNLCCSVLADIEFEGLHLDEERVQQEYVKAVTLKEELGAQLAEMTGGINLNSPKQLCEYLYDKLGMPLPRDHKGEEQRSANAKLMANLQPETEEQVQFLKLYKDYNKQTSLLEKNLEYFKLTCEQRGGKFFGNIRQAVVQTGRLASSGIPVLFEGQKKPKSVQLQNIPREFKKLFWSGEDDWEVTEVDGSQLEFRVAADMGNDKIATEEIETGVDIHSFTSRVLTEAGEPTDRQNSKQYTFKPLYGGGKGSKAVEAYCEFFKSKYTGISGTQRTWALKCVDRQQFTTPYGMIFYFPGTKMSRSGYISNTTSIYNFPVQGFATGEIIPIALVYFWHRIRGLPIKIFCTIHDSIAVKNHVSMRDTVLEIGKQALTSDVYEFLKRVYRYEFKVPLGLGAKSARNWGDTKIEVKYDIWPDGRIEDRT